VASLVDRIRLWLRITSAHTAEHEDIHRDLTRQQLAIRRIDAELSVRDRRQRLLPVHPRRRETD
jgi:hypothetical protein